MLRNRLCCCLGADLSTFALVWNLISILGVTLWALFQGEVIVRSVLVRQNAFAVATLLQLASG